MDWKKEKISASELERRQKEYMNAAMNMVKRSHITAPAEAKPVPEPIPEPEEQIGAAVTEVNTLMTEEITEEVTAVSEAAEGPEPEHEPEPEPAPEHEPEPVHNEDSSYGVYTADELLNADTANEGMKKAAEILEEMTRSTRMMKQLAGESDEPGVTDFPDFSCDTDSAEDGDCFREADADSEAEECAAAPDDE